jgi:hypothetical protein
MFPFVLAGNSVMEMPIMRRAADNALPTAG